MSAYEPIRVSTDDLPLVSRQEAIREFFGRMMQRMDYAPLGEMPMRIDATAVPLAGVTIGTSSSSALSIERSRELISDGRDDVLLSLLPTGAAVRSDKGLDVEVPPGDVLLCSINHPMRIAIPGEDKRVVTLQMPRASLIGLDNLIDEQPARAMPASLPVLRLLFGYVNSLEGVSLASAELRQKIGLHIVDLARLAIGPTGKADEEVRGSARAAKLALAKRYANELLSNPSLDAAEMASKLGISTRYLRMLFEPEGMSFVDYLLERRLERIHESLTDPRQLQRRIIDIAHEGGFDDIRTFNRAFRKRYGMTPSELRNAWKG